MSKCNGFRNEVTAAANETLLRVDSYYLTSRKLYTVRDLADDIKEAFLDMVGDWNGCHGRAFVHCALGHVDWNERHGVFQINVDDIDFEQITRSHFVFDENGVMVDGRIVTTPQNLGS